MKKFIWKSILPCLLLYILFGEAYGVLSLKRDHCYVNKHMYLDETFIYDTYYVFDESAADIYGRTFSLQYEFSIVPHYNCYHIYGEIRIDNQVYPCDYWTMYPNTPVAKGITGFGEIMYFFKSGYLGEGASFTKSPMADIELANGYQFHMITQGGYAPTVYIYKSDNSGEARYQTSDYTDYLIQYYGDIYQREKYIEK